MEINLYNNIKTNNTNINAYSKSNYNRNKQLTEDQLNIIKESFDLFDTDKTNKLDFHELKLTLKAFNFKITNEKFLDLVEKYNCYNNLINYNDYIDLMTELFNKRNPKEEAALAFDAFDVENKGKIGLKQLKQAVKELNTNIEDEDLKSIINEFDGDNDGYITKEDFLKILDEYYFN